LGLGGGKPNDPAEGEKAAENSTGRTATATETARATADSIERSAPTGDAARSDATAAIQVDTSQPRPISASETPAVTSEAPAVISETPAVTSETGADSQPARVTATPVPMPASPAPVARTPTVPSDTPMASVSSQAPRDTDSASGDSIQSGTQTIAATAPPVAQPGPVGDSGIVVRARADSWIQIRGGDDSGFNVARMLRTGDSYAVPNHPGLVLTTGNAGAIEIVINGRVAPPLGPSGAILRDLALDPERLLAGTASSR
jgi:cytoskeleton protein RodZ